MVDSMKEIKEVPEWQLCIGTDCYTNMEFSNREVLKKKGDS